MREKEVSKLYNSMTNVNSPYFDEIASYKKKSEKLIWVKRGIFAACICLTAIVAFTISAFHTHTSQNNQPLDAGTLDGNPAEYGQTADIAPMVCINRALYQIAGNQPDLAGKEDEFSYLGEISSTISSSQKPTKDFQANDDIIGSKVYQYDECIVVEINGQYWLYELLYHYLQQKRKSGYDAIGAKQALIYVAFRVEKGSGKEFIPLLSEMPFYCVTFCAINFDLLFSADI